MKKKFNEKNIINELETGSAFFRPDEPEKVATPLPPESVETTPVLSEPVLSPSPSDDTVIPRHHDTTVSRHHDTMTPWYHDTTIEKTRRAVKQLGKEAATHRFTSEEKKALRAIEQAYLNEQGIRTSENEITRIAINYIVEDYHCNGDKSILAQVIALLNS